MKVVRSQRWAYLRIIVGTISGGLLGFYVMHRAEISYKAKWEERLKKYEEEKMRRETTEFEADNTVYFSDDQQNGNEQHEL
ncbi:hypothetical protein SOVF_000670 [Spinacia oleracea]|uniref:Uncharacterized protein n=1 Tax=Spinacia oleracea TaxID=3562 RepID=A0ABM3QUL1_SPIOL|nr:uncharacterized protein LOC130462567 [Spinacia oleracea]KNA26084.1 hypothetical protein SOVF_000670 [Spinacia oleracea]